MKEEQLMYLCLSILVFVAFFPFFNHLFNSQLDETFIFREASLEVNQNIVSEKMIFFTDKNYHTLYRDFVDKISVLDNETKIKMIFSSCEYGTPYIRTSEGKCYEIDENSVPCKPYTENNEYGCTFGNTYGFQEEKEYSIEGKYILNPENIFVIDGQKYIKFIPYSSNKHPLLVRDKNLILSENIISKKRYFIFEDVILYVPISESIAREIPLTNFNYGNRNLKLFFLLIFLLVPAFLFFILWFLHGQEKFKGNVPKEISFYPKERKGWEVAVYFKTPFSKMDKNFTSALMMDLYRRKIIDIKTKENSYRNKETFVKLRKDLRNPNLDEVETQFISILEELSNSALEKHKDGDYFNLGKTSLLNSTQPWLISAHKKLKKTLKKKGKEYVNTKGNEIIFVIALIALFLSYPFISLYRIGLGIVPFALPYFVFSILALALRYTTPFFSSYKESHYEEFLRWESFSRYMKGNKMIKTYKKEAVVIWGHILVYSSALGIANTVLKQLKDAKIISAEEYNSYNSISFSSGSFYSGMSGGSSGGGFGGGGGMGGGGVGGGGGGGR